MIVTTKFLKPEEMNVAFTIIMPLAEAMKVVDGLDTVTMNWAVDDLRGALKATVRQVQESFTAIEHNPPKDSEE